MIDDSKLRLFAELFSRSNSIFIICAPQASEDQLLSATSLYASLKQNSGKNVKFFYRQTQKHKKNNDIFYLSEAKTDIGHENLCISLDYLEDSIDKVSYHTSEETKKFYLTVKPRAGFSPLSKDNVEFFYTGAKADMVILIGVNELKSLGKLYVGYEDVYNNTALVSINSYETEFGNLKLDVSGVSSFAEFIAQLLVDIDIAVDDNSATNLLNGINKATKNFTSYTATADTFEIIAMLIRSGARRNLKSKKPTVILKESHKKSI